MPTLTPADDNTKDPRVRAVFDDIKTTKKIESLAQGMIRGFQVLSPRPETFSLICVSRGDGIE